MKKLVVFGLLALVLTLAPLGAAEAADDIDSLLKEGTAALQKGDLQAAESIFREALVISPDNPEAALKLGTVLNRRGSAEARGFLAKALMARPDDASAQLEMGIFYYNKQIYQEALDFLEGARELAPGSDAARSAEQYIGAIKEQVAHIARPWELGLTLGLQHDSNVVLKTDGGAMPEGISGKDDMRATVLLAGSYDTDSKGRFRSNISYAFYQSLHKSLTDYNLQSHTINLTGQYLFKSMTLDMLYAFDSVWQGGQEYSLAHALRPSLVIPEGGGNFTVLYYRFKGNNYIDTPLAKRNSTRTGTAHMLGAVQVLPLGKTCKLKLGYSYETLSADQEPQDYTSNLVFADLQHSFSRTLSSNLYAQYASYQYGDLPNGDEGRTDKTTRVLLSLKKILTERYSLTLSYLSESNSSESSLYEFDRAITGAAITARF